MKAFYQQILASQILVTKATSVSNQTLNINFTVDKIDILVNLIVSNVFRSCVKNTKLAKKSLPNTRVSFFQDFKTVDQNCDWHPLPPPPRLKCSRFWDFFSQCTSAVFGFNFYPPKTPTFNCCDGL